MGKFREVLKIAEENNIGAYELLSATSVQCQIANLTDEQFEAISRYVYDETLATEYEPDDFTIIISQGLGDGDIERDMFLNAEGLKFIDGYVYERL